MVQKAEGWRIDVFKLWYWRRLLRVLWTARISKHVDFKGNQPWILIRRTDAEVEAPVFCYLMQRADSLECPWCWERLRAEGEECIRGWDGWMASPMWWTWTWANFGRWWGTERPGVPHSMGSERVRHDWVTGQQQQWQTHSQHHIQGWKELLSCKIKTGKGCQLSLLLFTIVLEVLDTAIKKKEEFQLEKK